jgi:hypothetical protein
LDPLAIYDVKLSEANILSQYGPDLVECIDPGLLFQEGMVVITGEAMLGFLRPGMAPLKGTIWIGAGRNHMPAGQAGILLAAFFWWTGGFWGWHKHKLNLLFDMFTAVLTKKSSTLWEINHIELNCCSPQIDWLAPSGRPGLMRVDEVYINHGQPAQLDGKRRTHHGLGSAVCRFAEWSGVCHGLLAANRSG